MYTYVNRFIRATYGDENGDLIRLHHHGKKTDNGRQGPHKNLTLPNQYMYATRPKYSSSENNDGARNEIMWHILFTPSFH